LLDRVAREREKPLEICNCSFLLPEAAFHQRAIEQSPGVIPAQPLKRFTQLEELIFLLELT
jgi:hypothetical protein